MNLHDPTAGEQQPLQLFFAANGDPRVAVTTRTYTGIFGAGAFHFNVGYDYLGKVAYITPWMPGASGAYTPWGSVNAY